MKCIKELSTDSITRVNDERAVSLVKKGTHVYVPKKEWKGFADPEPLKESIIDIAKLLGAEVKPMPKPHLKAKDRKAKDKKSKE